MKLLIVSSIVFLACNIVSAQTSLSVSIQADITSIFKTTQTQVSSASVSLSTAIQLAASATKRANVNARTVIIAILSRIGSDGKAIAAKLNADAEASLSTCDAQFSSQVSVIQQTFVNIQQNIAVQVQKDIDNLKAVVDFNKKAFKCWSDNRLAIQTLFRTSNRQVLIVVNSIVNSLASQNFKLVFDCATSAAKIQSEVLTKCGLFNNRCSLKHFLENYSSIFGRLDIFSSSSVVQTNSVVLEIQTRISAIAQVSTVFYQTVANNIRTCAKKYAPVDNSKGDSSGKSGENSSDKSGESSGKKSSEKKSGEKASSKSGEKSSS